MPAMMCNQRKIPIEYSMIYTPANTKCFTNEYNTNVRIKPEMIVPKIESSGFFIHLLLELKKLFYI